MEELRGGRANSIFRSEDKVYRPKGKWSAAVHKLLSHIKNEGFDAAPESYGFDENGNEVLSYVHGDVFNYPLKGNIATKEALISAGRLCVNTMTHRAHLFQGCRLKNQNGCILAENR